MYEKYEKISGVRKYERERMKKDVLVKSTSDTKKIH